MYDMLTDPPTRFEGTIKELTKDDKGRLDAMFVKLGQMAMAVFDRDHGAFDYTHIYKLSDRCNPWK